MACVSVGLLNSYCSFIRCCLSQCVPSEANCWVRLAGVNCDLLLCTEDEKQNIQGKSTEENFDSKKGLLRNGEIHRGYVASYCSDVWNVAMF